MTNLILILDMSALFLRNYYLILHGQHTSADICQSLCSTAERSDLSGESRGGQHEAIHVLHSDKVII